MLNFSIKIHNNRVKPDARKARASYPGRYVLKDNRMKLIATLFFLFPVLVYADTTTYSCNYTTYSDQEGNHKVEKKFELNFIVDKAAGKSYVLGNNGSTEIKLLESSDQLAFIEVTSTGNIMTTAIDSKLNSVHSRNSVMFGEMLPSRYYGKCEVK